MSAYVEVGLSWLFKNAKGRDAKSFATRPPFQDHPEPTIEISSPDCGASGVTLTKEYIADAGDRVPSLQWHPSPEVAALTKEWLLVVEDPDAPLPTPVLHGIYTGIPAEKTEVTSSDFEVEDAGNGRLKGGFYYGRNLRKKVYNLPRPLLNHGPHRYFFYVVALNAPVDPQLLSPTATREQISEDIASKVIAWGLWVGVAERQWS